jgi:Zn-finger nucleic acid-binding protein
MTDSYLKIVELKYICPVCKVDSLNRVQIGEFVFCPKCLGEWLAKNVMPMEGVAKVVNTRVKESDK